MDGGIIETPQYAENERPTGNEFESILQEVFLSYKNGVSVRSRWSQDGCPFSS